MTTLSLKNYARLAGLMTIGLFCLVSCQTHPEPKQPLEGGLVNYLVDSSKSTATLSLIWSADSSMTFQVPVAGGLFTTDTVSVAGAAVKIRPASARSTSVIGALPQGFQDKYTALLKQIGSRAAHQNVILKWTAVSPAPLKPIYLDSAALPDATHLCTVSFDRGDTSTMQQFTVVLKQAPKQLVIDTDLGLNLYALGWPADIVGPALPKARLKLHLEAYKENLNSPAP